MDLLPWPKLRERVINERDRYDCLKFQRDYAANIRINFPYHPSNVRQRLAEGQRAHGEASVG